MKRLFALLSVLALISGCGTLQDDNDPLMQLFPGQSGPAVDSRFAALLKADAPALQIGFIESGLSGTLLLEQSDGAFETWLSPDGAAIVLQNGMLHSLKGLGAGLLASEVSESLALVRSGQTGPATRLHTFLTGDDRAQTRSYKCDIENKGERQIKVGDRRVGSILMQESCRNLNQSFFNLYWVAHGDIVQSRQWSGDFVGAISTRILPGPN